MIRNLLISAIVKTAAAKADSGKADSGRGYVSLRLTNDSAKKLHKAVLDAGVVNPIRPDKMHLTLMYDKSDPKIPDYSSVNKSYEAGIKAVKQLGKGKYKALALELISPEITKRHEDLVSQGFDHSHKNFLPHVSLKYKPSDGDFKKIKRNLNDIKSHISLTLANESAERLSD